MSGESLDVTYSREELLEQAERLAQNSSLHTDARAAWQLVRNGALEGTMFASELTGIFFLLGEDEPLPLAAE